MEQLPAQQSIEESADLAATMAARLRHERFVDAHEVNIDANGRVSLPAVYRPAFDEGSLRMTAVRDRNLEFWTPHTFELVLEHRRRLGIPRLSGPRGLKLFQSRTTRIAVDKQFRLVVPPALRERIGLDPAGDRIVLAGMGESIELWAAADWTELDHSGELDELEYGGF